MRLFDLLDVVEDNNEVIVYIKHNEVSRYDGRDSIDSYYNYSQVLSVFPTYDEYRYKTCIGVEIAED